ncbi:MAG: AI-2E family transporter [Clostridia bacterium]|nr:AI-2E family transporter [Clostridia bacterium]
MKKFKIPYLNLIPILLIAFLLFKLVNNTQLSITGIVKLVYGCIAYFVTGFALAYLLNPALNFFENLIRSKHDSSKAKAIKRAGVILFIYLLLIGLVTVFVIAVIPTVRNGITEMVEHIPQYVTNIEAWIADFFGVTQPQLTATLNNWVEEGSKFFYNWIKTMDFSSISGAVSSGVSSVATGVIRFGFGIITSIYFLFSKERLILSLKKLVYVLLGQKKAEKVIDTGREINSIFLNYIVSRLLQSAIMFLIGLIVLVPLKIPLAPMIALFIAITNMIPYFGPTIGTVISVLITLLYSPVKALWVLIFALAIQVLDNAIIGPKIVSDQVGISPLWVILGVTLGGAFGGVLGMFIGVPVVATVKLVFYDRFIERKLKEQNIELS